MDGNELIDLNLDRAGQVTMPASYAIWLDDADLVAAFDEWWCERRDAMAHGDPFTPFAEKHFAPPPVQACLKQLR